MSDLFCGLILENWQESIACKFAQLEDMYTEVKEGKVRAEKIMEDRRADNTRLSTEYNCLKSRLDACKAENEILKTKAERLERRVDVSSIKKLEVRSPQDRG